MPSPFFFLTSWFFNLLLGGRGRRLLFSRPYTPPYSSPLPRFVLGGDYQSRTLGAYLPPPAFFFFFPVFVLLETWGPPWQFFWAGIYLMLGPTPSGNQSLGLPGGFSKFPSPPDYGCMIRFFPCAPFGPPKGRGTGPLQFFFGARGTPLPPLCLGVFII